VDVSGQDDQKYLSFAKSVIGNTVLACSRDPYLLEELYVAVATISCSPKLIKPLTVLYEFKDDFSLHSDGTTIDIETFKSFVSSFIKCELIKTTTETKGDRRPSIVLITKNTFDVVFLYKMSVDLHLGNHIVTDGMRSRLLVLNYLGINETIHLPHIIFDVYIEAFADDPIDIENTINIIKL
jgi:hypothetical protein